MALSEFSIVSLAEVKSFLNIDSDDTASDAWLEIEIDRMSQHLERYLDRKIIARQFKKDFNGTDTEILYLDNTPVLQVDGLYQDDAREFGDDTKIEMDAYSVFIDRVELFYGFFHPGVRTVRVDYAAGFGEIEIPFSRTRVDFREEMNGDLQTVYLSADRNTPTEIADCLEIELNSVGTHDRSIRFDYKTRKFTITQTGGTLVLVPSDTGAGFSESDSALPLLGFTGSGYTSSPAVGNVLTLALPVDLRGAVIDLIANRYDFHSDSDGGIRRGIQSERTGDYQVTYASGGSAADGAYTQHMQLGMTADIQLVLDRYRRAVYF